MTSIAPISHQIWDMKYRLKKADGTPLDDTIEDTWRRVARALAAPEAEAARADWEQTFYAAMDGFRFLPAGRIVAGAGTARNVTLFNCFVMGVIPDDMSGIFEHLREAALTMQQGGGIGYDFSTLRPKGAPVKGVGADASGPLSFMDVWDAMCRTIMSAGSRRGAMMATLRCDHPDIEAFVTAKQDPGRLRMFNLSVLVTDAFMAAVKADDAWNLVFDGRVYKTLPARELWDKIMAATYAYAEPGVIFIDRVNAENNLRYCETISATNPCVTAETWIATAGGPRQARDLVGRPFLALVDGAPQSSGREGFFETGVKPVIRLETREGLSLRLTADHPVLRVTSRTRYRRETCWTPAGGLSPGDRIVLHDHRDAPAWPGPHGEAEGYLIGLLIGDGTLKADKAVLSAWPGRIAVGGGYERPGVAGLMQAAEAAAATLPHHADFAGWMAVPSRGEYRLALAAVADLARELGLAPGRKDITPAIEKTSSAFYRGFLRGMFDADGGVQGGQEKAVSLRLAQSDLDRLEAVQRMLLRLGIMSRIYRNRRPPGERAMPDGHGGRRLNRHDTQHELAISGENIARYAREIGFADFDKASRLRSALDGYSRRFNQEHFLATVSDIGEDGTAAVYDVRIPGVNAFDANGLFVHNCGEQPLPPYGACLLGSINLARLVHDPFRETAHIDEEELGALVRTAVRMMDNVVDISRFPLDQQRQEALAKRRIGLGVTGLGDALILARQRYGSGGALELTKRWMKAIERAAYLASAELAREKGAFPLYDEEKYLESPTIQRLDEDVQAEIRKNGIRNALLTSVAPTGTISIFADNVSSGLEPVFSFTYTRKVLMPDGTRREEEVSDYALRLYRRMFGERAALPDYFVDAMRLSPIDHVRMQAAVQTHIDSSISKTINCPEDLNFEAFKDVYLAAYDLGCKGCTTYRPNEVTGAVLEASGPRAAAGGEEAAREEPMLPFEEPPARPRDPYEAGGVVYMTRPLDRPGVLEGRSYKIKWPDSDHALYITINDIIQDGRRRPFEVFINSKNTEHYAWTVALTRMISAVFRRGGDVSFVVEELKAVFDPRGGHWMQGRYVPSLLAAIGEVIEQHMISIGFIPAAEERRMGEKAAIAVATPGDGTAAGAEAGDGAYPRRAPLRPCPRCGAASLVRQEGCDVCLSCGHSKCA